MYVLVFSCFIFQPMSLLALFHVEMLEISLENRGSFISIFAVAMYHHRSLYIPGKPNLCDLLQLIVELGMKFGRKRSGMSSLLSMLPPPIFSATA